MFYLIPAVVSMRRPMTVLVRVPTMSPPRSAVGFLLLLLLPASLFLPLVGLVEQVADSHELKTTEKNHFGVGGKER
jgi:hypothetical protein